MPQQGELAGMSVRRKSRAPRGTVDAPTGGASACLGTLSPGDSISIITCGQFSLLDLLFAILAQTGPADVIISTWTMGIRDAENAEALLRRGTIRSLRLLVDRSFPTRQPRYAERVRQRFGDGAFVLSRVHAKFAVVLGGDLSVCVRSSMNLNANKRWEQADIDVDPGLCSFYAGLVDQLGGALPAGLDVSESAIEAGLDRVIAKRASANGTRQQEAAREQQPIAEVDVRAGGAEIAPPEDYWTRALRQAEEWLAGAIEDRSWSAVATLGKKRDEIQREIERREAEAAMAAIRGTGWEDRQGGDGDIDRLLADLSQLDRQ